MKQVSRPMQIALGAILLFAIVWFVVLRPKTPAVEPVAATPPAAAASTTPRDAAGGTTAQTAIGKTIESAKNSAASADSAVKARDSETGDTAPTTGTTPAKRKVSAAVAAARAAGTTPAATSPAATTPTTPAARRAAAAAAAEAALAPAQKRANALILQVKRDLAARKAVIILVWSKTSPEDRVLHTRVTKKVNKRGGKVKIFAIDVKDIGRYDGLLSGLDLGQTPSTIVIAPNNEAKVLGGIQSTGRIDRLTSAAILTAPVAAKGAATATP